MRVLILVQVMIATFFCAYCTYTDIRYNRIRNKVVIKVGTVGVLISTTGYLLVSKNLLLYYFINISIAVILSQIMYAAHIWAAGDSKMYICMSTIIPIFFSFFSGRVLFSSIFIAAYAFLIGFVYLLTDTIVLMLKKEIKIEISSSAPKIKDFVLNYAKNIVILTGLWSVEDVIINKIYDIHPYGIAIINICILMLVSLLKGYIKNAIVLVFAILEIAMFLFFGILSLGKINIKYCILILFLMVFKIMVDNGNYVKISSADVKRGMILSTATTFMMSTSDIVGLPSISRENMADRLTEKEAEAVRRWGLIKGKPIEIQILRKVPFAIFLSLGMLVQIIGWGIWNFAYK